MPLATAVGQLKAVDLADQDAIVYEDSNRLLDESEEGPLEVASWEVGQSIAKAFEP